MRKPFEEWEQIGEWHQATEEVVPYYGEYAGHDEKWRLHKGSSPIRIAPGPGTKQTVALRPATRVYYAFHNRIGAHGSTTVKREPVTGHHSRQMDAFRLANAVREGKATLCEGFEIVSVGTYHDGSEMIRVARKGGGWL